MHVSLNTELYTNTYPLPLDGWLLSAFCLLSITVHFYSLSHFALIHTIWLNSEHWWFTD